MRNKVNKSQTKEVCKGHTEAYYFLRQFNILFKREFDYQPENFHCTDLGFLNLCGNCISWSSSKNHSRGKRALFDSVACSYDPFLLLG